MDAFAVSVGVGTQSGTGSQAFTAAWRLALACGLFQFFMPLLGRCLGEYSTRWFPAIDHWLAFGLLAFVGGNMIRDYFMEDEKAVSEVANRTGLLLSVALATSIDALVVGAGFALAGLSVMELAVIAGVVTALACAAGVYLGRLAGMRFGKRMELLGGATLILIGLEMLVSHLVDHGVVSF